MSFIKYIHHYPSALHPPAFLLKFLLKLPMLITRVSWGGSSQCTFNKIHSWPSKSDVIYIRCPMCSTERLWNGTSYKCSCGFSTNDLFLQQIFLFGKLIYLATFFAWSIDDGTWYMAVRVRGDYDLHTQQLILNTACRSINGVPLEYTISP